MNNQNQDLLNKIRKYYEQAYNAHTECDINYRNDWFRIHDSERVLGVLEEEVGKITRARNGIQNFLSQMDPEEARYEELRLENVNNWLEEVQGYIASMKEDSK